MLSAIKYVTLGVSDLDRALRLYRDVMGFAVDVEYPLPATLRNLWSLPEETTGHIVELSNRGYPIGRLRLVALSPTPTTKVRSDEKGSGADSAHDIGPKAIDFYVKAPIEHAIGLMKTAGYRARSEPIKHEISGIVSEELIFTGPDDVPLLLMVGHSHTAQLMRPGTPEGDFSEIATVSIIGGSVERSRAFYGQALGMTVLTDAETAPEYRDLVCDLTGVPRDTNIHWLLYGGLGEPSGKILIVHFGEISTRRLEGRMHPAHLGFALLTHATKDLDALVLKLEAQGFSKVAGPAKTDYGPHRYRALLVRGPNEELLEVFEER